jgi:hypothetical protein
MLHRRVENENTSSGKTLAEEFPFSHLVLPTKHAMLVSSHRFSNVIRNRLPSTRTPCHIDTLNSDCHDPAAFSRLIRIVAAWIQQWFVNDCSDWLRLDADEDRADDGNDEYDTARAAEISRKPSTSRHPSMELPDNIPNDRCTYSSGQMRSTLDSTLLCSTATEAPS